MKEEWRRLIYHDDDLGDYYLVSNKGEIKNAKTGKIRKKNINRQGYYFVGVSLGSRKLKKIIKIHRAVAESFIPKVVNKNVINHIDCNKLNNYVDNLEWCTLLENTAHAKENNLTRHDGVPIKCLETGEVFESVLQASLWCKCSRGTICDFLCRKDKNRKSAGRHPETGERLHWAYVNLQA